MTLPTFIVAGAAKSGSTTLHAHLREHPEIFMCREKEPDYFNRHWEARGLDWYEGLFAGRTTEPAIGEASVDYMADPAVPERIRQTIPEVRLLFILREPVERAWSQYWQHVRVGRERRPFDVVIGDGDVDPYVIRCSLYAQHLRRFHARFPAAQILTVIYEELLADPRPSMEQIFRFLGVSADRAPSTLRHANQAATPRSMLLSRSMAWMLRMQRAKNAVPGWLYGPLRSAFSSVSQRNLRRGANAPLPEKERRLLRDVFAETVLDVETMIGRDIPAWHVDEEPGPQADRSHQA